MSNFIKNLMDKANMTRNQIAQISGLSNSHIKSLEEEDIKKIKRDTAIFLAVALNLDFQGINELLLHYSFSNVSENDIEIFIRAAERRRIAGFQPLYNNVAFDLLLLSLEMLNGDLIVINDKPSTSFKPTGFFAIEAQNASLSRDYIYLKLMEKIYQKRREVLDRTLIKYSIHYLACEECIIEYMKKFEKAGAEERGCIKEHFKLLLEYINNSPNYQFDLIERTYCPRFRFEMKQLPSNSKESDKVFFIGNSKHGSSGDFGFSPDLHGFATDSKRIYDYFKFEYFRLKKYIIRQYSDKNLMTNHIKETFHNITGSDIDT